MSYRQEATLLNGGWVASLFVKGNLYATVSLYDVDGYCRFYHRYDWTSLNTAERNYEALVSLGTVQSAREESAA